MKIKRILALLITLSFSLPSFALSFDVKSEAELSKYTDKELVFKITKQKKHNPESFPEGTLVYGHIVEHKPNRRLYRDEFVKLQLDKAVLPNGSAQDLNQSMMIRPRKFLNPQMAGIGAIAATGGVLGITISFLTLGLPIVRGGLALWDAGYEVYDKPQGASGWKAAGKGFLDGALFPIPQIVMKARKLGMVEGSRLVVYPAKAGKTVYMSVPRKDTKIENHRV